MNQIITCKGRVVGPHQIEVAESLPNNLAEVQVSFFIPKDSDDQTVSFQNLTKMIGEGRLTKEQIDNQLREERDSWDT